MRSDFRLCYSLTSSIFNFPFTTSASFVGLDVRWLETSLSILMLQVIITGVPSKASSLLEVIRHKWWTLVNLLFDQIVHYIPFYSVSLLGGRMLFPSLRSWIITLTRRTSWILQVTERTCSACLDAPWLCLDNKQVHIVIVLWSLHTMLLLLLLKRGGKHCHGVERIPIAFT